MRLRFEKIAAFLSRSLGRSGLKTILMFIAFCTLAVSIAAIFPAFGSNPDPKDKSPVISEPVQTEEETAPATAPETKNPLDDIFNDETQLSDDTSDENENTFISQETYPPTVDEVPDYGDEPAVLRKTDDMGEEYLSKIIFIGDSRTYGLKYYKVIPGRQVWVPANGTLYISSATKAKIVYETGEEITIREAAKLRQPEIVMISLGINGIAALNEKQFDYSLRTLIEQIRDVSPGTHIILNSMYPVSDFYENLRSINNEKIQEGNKWILEIAKKYNCKFLDSYSVLLDSNGFLDRNYQNGDGLHPNKEGYKLLTEFFRTHALEGTNPENGTEETVPETGPVTDGPVPETTPATEPVTVPETAPETAPETVPETVPETIPETVPETTPETTQETVAETTPETVPEITPQTDPETTPETETSAETGHETEPKESDKDPPEISVPEKNNEP